MEDTNCESPSPPPADNGPGDSNTEKKGAAHNWFFSTFIRNGLRFTFALSLGVFALYMAGSIPDPGFSDRMLFFLLSSLRSVSLASSAFSVFALGFSVHRLVVQPSPRRLLNLCFYFSVGLFSVMLALLDSLILAASVGNI